jgi:hypothetical protein
METVVPVRRRLPIDLAVVARAMDDSDRASREYVLDVHTGEVIVLPRAALEGAAADSLPAEIREALPRARTVARARPGRYVSVPQRPPPDDFDIMQRFVASVPDADLRRRLQRALGGHAPFRHFREALADDVDEEARWQTYGEAVRQIEAREWLQELDIEPLAE